MKRERQIKLKTGIGQNFDFFVEKVSSEITHLQIDREAFPPYIIRDSLTIAQGHINPIMIYDDDYIMGNRNIGIPQKYSAVRLLELK
jgi:hypothetical protein